MKTSIMYSLALLFLFSTPSIYGQKASETAREKNMKTRSAETFCDDEIFKLKSSLERLANSSCRTVKKTIECTDRKSGMKVHVILIVQPTKDHCPDVRNVEGLPMPASRGAGPEFEVVILQEPCSRGGVSLTAYIPGYDSQDKKIAYDYQWLANGEPMGTERSLQCVTVKEVELKVMEKGSGIAVKKKIYLSADQPGRDNYRMYGFKKTACFGNCPVYEVSIYKDGRMSWNGKMNVERMGRWEAKLEPQVMKRIKDQVFKYNYFDLHNKYPVEGEVADASRTITYVRVGDMEKTIDHALGGPDNLVEFEEFLQQVIDGATWRAEKEGNGKKNRQ